MSETIKISYEDFLEYRTRWKNAEEEIKPEINTLEPNSELETLKRYLENYQKLSQLIKDYISLSAEDRERVLAAGEEMLKADSEVLN